MAEQEKKTSPERVSGPEVNPNIIHEQKELIRAKLEEAEKKHHEKNAEHEALEEATTLAEKNDKKREEQEHPAAPREKLRGAPSKKQLAKTFNEQMSGVQAEMNTGGKVFSKFLHMRAVEKTSDAVATTVARPNAMLSGSIAAFITITAVYFIARHYGYRLSGFETIGAFIVGWILGILYDYLSLLVRNNHRR